MVATKLLVITGLPASGKTTLARLLAQRYSAPLLAKDAVKEPLLDVLGAGDAAQSRKLSDASFAVLLNIAEQLLAANVSVILEGNFRPGEHEASMQPALKRAGRVAQILCRTEERVRLQRLAARSGDPTRHPGHRDIDLARAHASALSGDAFLSIAGEQLLYADARGMGEDSDRLATFDAWWQG